MSIMMWKWNECQERGSRRYLRFLRVGGCRSWTINLGIVKEEERNTSKTITLRNDFLNASDILRNRTVCCRLHWELIYLWERGLRLGQKELISTENIAHSLLIYCFYPKGNRKCTPGLEFSNCPTCPECMPGLSSNVSCDELQWL